ncbi:MAG TPA: alpha/beta hydrolase [Streptosporangiaceae bacterium]
MSLRSHCLSRPGPHRGLPARCSASLAASCSRARQRQARVVEDGTVIAYDRAGQGPPLIVAVGAFCDRRTFVPPVDLTARFTVYNYDRRGRGDSGDTQPYSPEREVADLAAVIKAAAEPGSGSGSVSAGGGAFVFGHSSGAALALRAAWEGVPIAAVAAHEAPYFVRDTAAEDPAARITELVGAGRRGDAVRYWMNDVVHAPAQVVKMMEGSPSWPGLEAMTHTLPYDLELSGDRGVPADNLATITVPVLVLGGANSPDWFRRTVEETSAAIPDARLVTLEGLDHGAPPAVLTPVLTEFFLGSAR